MANIDKELNDIKNAVYGREVRGSIHDGIKKINEESEESKQKAEEAHEITQDLLDETFDSAALEANFEQRLNDEIENLQPEWTQFKDDTEQSFQNVETQLADIVQDVDSIKFNKADKTYVDNKLSEKMNRGETIEVSQIDKNKGKFDETYMTDEFLQQMAGNTPIHSVPADESITTIKLVNNSATYDKRTRLGEKATITIASHGEIPVIDTKNRTITFPDTFFVLSGKRRFIIEGGISLELVHSLGNFIYFDTKEEVFEVRPQTDLSNVSENDTLLAAIYFTSGIGDALLGVDISCPYRVNGIYYLNYFMEDVSPEKISPSGEMAVVTPGLGSKLPNFNSTDYKLSFNGNFNIIFREKRFFIEGPKVFDFSVIDSAGRKLYYSPSQNEFIIVDQRQFPDSELILIAVFYSYADGVNLVMNGDFTIDGKHENDVDFKPYKFSVEKIKENYPDSDLLAIGDPDSPFDYNNDNHELVYSLFDNLMDENPEYITKTEIGRSETGDIPIYKYEFFPLRPRIELSIKPYPKILLGGAIHGGENLAVSSLYFLFERICKEWHSDSVLEYLRHNINFVVVPLQNPYDYDNKFYNGQDNEGINLNRDFDWEWTKTDYTGNTAFSRSESRAIRDFLFDNDDAMYFIDCHVRGGRQVVEDEKMMWLAHTNRWQAEIGANTIEQLTRRWRSKYELANVPFYGIESINSGARTVRGYSHNVVGIPATTWEGFSASESMTEIEGKDVVDMNVDFLGQFIVDVIKYYQYQ